MRKPLNILFISSMPPQKSAGLGADYVKALEQAGHHVDFLTRYDYEGRRENDIYVYKDLSTSIRLLAHKYKILNIFRWLNIFLKKEKKVYHSDAGITITNMYEDRPLVALEDILKVITKRYDVVVTLFWQYMLTTVSLKAIYDKLKCPIIIRSVDMHTYTGGCFYFLDCRNFTHGCGCCPALGGNDRNDQTHLNFLIKKKMYSSMNYAIGLNSWMQQFARKTGLFEPERIITTSAAIDESHFLPMEKDTCRHELCIPEKYGFVLFARSVNSDMSVAKGFNLLKKSINLFVKSLKEEDKQSILLLLAGCKLKEEELKEFNIEVKELGFVDTDTLIKVYNASNVFLSPSIDDAGPSMVNQSIMCGTPVVCYDIGTAWDVIDNGKSGFKVPVKDYVKFADAIFNLFNMQPDDYAELSYNTRKIALKHNSLKSFSEMIESTYDKLISNNFCNVSQYCPI